MRNRYASRRPEEAIVNDDGTRHCACCGDFIDPIDWCGACTPEAPCATTGGPHRRLRKRSDAAFCDAGCRAAFDSDNPSVGRRRQSAYTA